MTDQDINVKIAFAQNICFNGYYKTPSGFVVGCPDYVDDLNAVHIAEENLLTDPFDRRKYYQTLDEMTGDQWNTIVASARARSVALLKTLGKWEEA
jgi:hypothetical protein